ncbi:hypothetical protein QWJ34_17325 [Saccharibacillus sp. CPCC 101409]|uniref:hypothetical protein n=1 Tax=Saccharibacillus sp. CPCC 101409 TaxID=3058041 RepID=UPI002671E5A8|nr:hypothetical protein [Saccharibacillus sp. CPCC 101409]MDO3411530.1 hypothetical protein [Saccharibacillus sp. CPCC 101409]
MGEETKRERHLRAIEAAVLSAAGALQTSGLPYLFVGSVSTWIQGCEIVPNDVDLLMREAADVRRALRVLNPDTDEGVRFFEDAAGIRWTFARGRSHGAKIEIAHIEPPEEDESGGSEGIWENGPSIWAYKKTHPFAGLALPVVPLEIQLATCLNRGLEQRADAVIRVLKRGGCDWSLLRRAIPGARYAQVAAQIEKPKRR